MYIYIVIESNRREFYNDEADEYAETIGGVYASLEEAQQHKPHYYSEAARIEKWELGGANELCIPCPMTIDTD